MSCSCRAVSWRTFVRGLAQVHRLDAASTVVLQLGPRVLRERNRPWAAARENRGLHTSRFWGQDESAAVIVRESDDSKPLAEISVAHTGKESSPVISSPEKTVEAMEEGERRKEKTEKKSQKSKSRKTETREAPARPKKEWRDSSKTKPQSRTPYKAYTNQQRPTKAKARDGEESEPKPKLETWQIQKAALKAKFPEGWKPRKRLSPDALAGIRALNAQFPESYTTDALATKFQVSPEAIRRILRSKWTPTAKEEGDREDRWFRRGKRVWEQKAALGVKPPKMWRMEGVTRDPEYHEWSRRASQREREWEEEEIRKYREYREKKKRQQEERERGEGGHTRR